MPRLSLLDLFGLRGESESMVRGSFRASKPSRLQRWARAAFGQQSEELARGNPSQPSPPPSELLFPGAPFKLPGDRSLVLVLDGLDEAGSQRRTILSWLERWLQLLGGIELTSSSSETWHRAMGPVWPGVCTLAGITAIGAPV